jgi:hypothetical protein
MSAELERQLRKAFMRLPKPSRAASARARSAALTALGPPGARSRGALVVVAVAVACVVGAGAAALAATGNLRVAIGAKQKAASTVPARLVVPAGSNGIAVVAGGKLWLATRRGLRIEGMPVSAAELSPRALYAVVGIGSSLVTLAPGNRRPWVHETAGRVIAAAWSPDGLKIAYVVARRGGDELRLIEGDGAPDRLLVRGVSSAKPSWRSDSLAVAFIDGRRRAAVYDLGSSTTRTFDTRRCSGRARIVAYSPRGKRLAVAGPSGLSLVERWDRPLACAAFDRLVGMNGLAWLSGEAAVTSEDRPREIVASSSLRSYLAGSGGTLAVTGGAITPKRVRAIAAPSGGGPALVAFQSAARAVELAEVGLVRPQNGRLRIEKPLVRLNAPGSAVTISWR